MSKKQSEKASNKKDHSKAKAAKEQARGTGRQLDPRMPAVGTVIAKRDRHGNVRCKCRVARNGIRYNGTLYRSLSGAAMAAATDLGLESPTQNGFTFWALS
jgi:hypothetical protein